MKKLWIVPLLPLLLVAAEFKVASYNVENLFDLKKSGSEYTEYIPFTGYGWNEKAFATKVRNISRVICDLKPDIIGLQEIESDEALKALQKGLMACGWKMPYRAIADNKPTVVKTALLSRYPIVEKSEIDPDGSLRTRNILETTVDLNGKHLKVFVNHWKSRNGPESRRIVSAEALMKRAMSLPKESDYILLGDFNSDWNEWRTLPKSPRLNDTGGMTGINHILKTVENGKPVTKRTIVWPCHYDLWLELPPQKRWSHNFYGHKHALDHMLLPVGMFDARGINYKDRSFRKFTPRYLFTERGALYRWQVAKQRRGKHLGAGYSDHLPVYAYITTKPFGFSSDAHKRADTENYVKTAPRTIHIAELYSLPLGWMNGIVEDAVVIYKRGKIAILKEPRGRSILVYRDTGHLKKGHRFKVAIRKLYEYKGLREVTKVDVLKDLGKADVEPLLLKSVENLSDPGVVNEVVASVSGIYRRGYLYYGQGKKIKLFFRDRKRRPKNGETVRLQKVRIGIYRNRPELVVD
ncbi:endonuclease/exonuclease/phosphatase family protein [Hydrogenimonas urashimensis]|uniref:endonuclease/exonuclease/phosphatase family protein n=1 Tax=Hydrogenimonas urashimensis TaxID=2740515 RepID=UPI0019165125|nr:endonuclease/exonuclease/phosphatase family protein [Hydrogenimonas urashimensis]